MAAKKRAKKVVKDKNLGKSFFIPQNALYCSTVHTSLKNLSDAEEYELYDGDEITFYEVTVVRSWKAQKKSGLTVTPV